MKMVLISQLFLFIFFSTCQSSISAPTDPLQFTSGEENLEQWENGILSAAAAQAPGPASDGPLSTLLLAENRTKRPDILHHFRRYRGGWDIANKHYWASVGFTGAVGFIFAVLWVVSFGLALVAHHCCGWRIDIKGKESNWSRRICLMLLIVFTCAAA